MRGRELAAKGKNTISGQTLMRQKDEAEAHNTVSYQVDPPALAMQPVGQSNPASAYATLLNRATAAQPTLAQSSLLQLQRRYGNRYVQRVLAIARQSSESSDCRTAVAGGARTSFRGNGGCGGPGSAAPESSHLLAGL